VPVTPARQETNDGVIDNHERTQSQRQGDYAPERKLRTGARQFESDRDGIPRSISPPQTTSTSGASASNGTSTIERKRLNMTHILGVQVRERKHYQAIVAVGLSPKQVHSRLL